jgi:hypothetical protein
MQKFVTMTLASLLFVGACASRVNSKYEARSPGQPTAAARSAENVELVNANTPDRPYVNRGTIEADVNGGGTEPRAALMWRMRERAGREGCDAVVVPGKPLDRVDHATGACVVYTDDAHVAAAGSR